MAKKTSSPDRFADRPGLNRLLFAIALLGVLVVAHLAIQQGRGFDQGCWGFNPDDDASAAVFDCALVTESSSGTLLGLSNVVWGLGFYLGVAALSAALAFASPARRRPLGQARAVLIGGGFLYAMYLVYEQFFTIGELCALCLTSAGIATTLFAVQAFGLFGPTAAGRRETRREARPAYYAALAGLVVLLIGADVVYFNNLETAPPTAEAATPAPTTSPDVRAAASSLPAECRYREEVPPVENHRRLVSFGDPVKGDPSAPVTVIEYFDPNCPHCRDLYPVMEEVAGQYGDEAQFVYVPYMIWPDRSMNQVAALHEAARQGTFFEMLEAQFEMQQGSLSNEQLRQIATEIGMDAEQMIARIENGTYTPAILERKEQARTTGMTGLPSVFVNGRLVETLTADCLGEFIEEAAGAKAVEG